MATRKKTTRPEMSAAKRAEINAAILDRNSDSTNADFLFSLTHTALRLAIRDGLISAEYLARRELANRGLDQNGEWVGFPRAAEIHEVK